MHFYSIPFVIKCTATMSTVLVITSDEARLGLIPEFAVITKLNVIRCGTYSHICARQGDPQ